jgi:hypothetical protein
MFNLIVTHCPLLRQQITNLKSIVGLLDMDILLGLVCGTCTQSFSAPFSYTLYNHEHLVCTVYKTVIDRYTTSFVIWRSYHAHVFIVIICGL